MCWLFLVLFPPGNLSDDGATRLREAVNGQTITIYVETELKNFGSVPVVVFRYKAGFMVTQREGISRANRPWQELWANFHLCPTKMPKIIHAFPLLTR
jgi:hypothetical protein